MKHKGLKIRVVPRSSNEVRVYGNPKDVSIFLLGRRLSEYIVLVDYNYYVKQFLIDTNDVEEIEMRLDNLCNQMIREVDAYV